MIKNFWRKLLKKDKLIVKKTDNELVRYIKQNTIIEERKRYEDLMQKEMEKKAKGLNDKEKKLLYFHQIETLPSREYDKSNLNDNVIDFSYLTDKKNYLFLGQKYRPLYPKPFYASKNEFSDHISLRTYAIRIIGSLMLLKIGYEIGLWDGNYVNQQLAKSVVIEFETEEQIFDYLINKDKTAVFIYLYSPGHFLYERFNKSFEIASPKYQDEIVFMRVHCRKHLTFCLNKMWPERIAPIAEAYFINDSDQIEIADFHRWHRSEQGIEGFFEEHGLIEPKLHPEKILERIGTRYLHVI